ncbi:YdcF family protein [Sphingomonas sp. BGYR3]|uniref:YdcF family protein n=1 Tax=Sphingomonas sp. BGYR3 TaxID=2975483 RepID=UPI0021A2F3F9|nr:YdcF family protein [Sphingomonas sp. BGYR3]MDG5488621.1 YdcF family protein [Sphingomonas sp. BGYR3]
MMLLRWAARLIALAFILWIGGLAWFLVSFGQPATDERTDAIVVVTGAAGRIDRGLALMRAGEAKRMLISGVDPDVRPVELAVQYGAPTTLFRCCVDLGHEAVDTRSNADETRAWVLSRRYRSVRLVTSDWHMARASLELRNSLGPDIRVVEDPVATNAPFRALLREYHKYAVRRLALLLGIGG